MKKTLLIIAVTGMIFTSCAQEKKGPQASEDTYAEANTEVVEEVEQVEEVAQQNIVEIAAGNENFSTLVAAVKAGDLVSTLSSSGPFTVFAPTNDAFGKLPAGTVESLLMPENKTMLTDILTYHVVAGKYMANDVVSSIKKGNGTFSTNTVNGEKITFMMEGQNVVIKDAKGGKSVIIMTDVDASNGVIHAINTVIMPKG